LKLISTQEGFAKKIKRQQELAEYSKKAEFHCGGNLFHVGKVSYGCKGCFTNPENNFTWLLQVGEDVGLPNVCTFACDHCFPQHTNVENCVKSNYVVPSDWEMKREWKENIKTFCKTRKRLDYFQYAFTGSESEPLFYIPVIKEYMNFYINELEPIYNQRGFAKVLTNGVFLNKENIQRLKDIRIDEVRVNVTSSNFSKRVYKNIEEAVKHFPSISVEVPLWPLYRTGLFEMLPIINDIGVKHLDLCQVEIWNRDSLQKMSAVLPDEAEYFQVGFMMNLDDGGLYEELVKEIIDKNYNYSVIDCNAFVKLVYEGSNRLANEMTFEEDPFDIQG
tara:strand:+ start:506 stop:1504 length:999 start_codon:yes stop_codon:yes gene_type:complete